MTIERVAIVGLGLIGGSVGLAVQQMLPGMTTTGWDADADVRQRAAGRRLVGEVCDTVAEAVRGADLVILCVPVGAMRYAAEAIAPHLEPGTIVSDVGSCKGTMFRDVRPHLPDGVHMVPAHPVAGTEHSGPEAGFTELFEGRWCVLTPADEADAGVVERVAKLWRQCKMSVEVMDAAHHDQVMAITSHLPHLISYTIVGTANDLEDDLKKEVFKFSAGGFRDFTRIAASDPVMWRDIFLKNRVAVLELLGRFTEDLAALQRAIRRGEGEALEDHFTRTRDIRRGVIDAKQN